MLSNELILIRESLPILLPWRRDSQNVDCEIGLRLTSRLVCAEITCPQDKCKHSFWQCCRIRLDGSMSMLDSTCRTLLILSGSLASRETSQYCTSLHKSLNSFSSKLVQGVKMFKSEILRRETEMREQ